VAARPRHPRPPQKTLPGHVREQAEFLDAQLPPRLQEAQAGKRPAAFVDASPLVFGTSLCCLWSFARLLVRAASGRRRCNVPGAWDAVTRRLTAGTNPTVVNTQTMGELLGRLASQGRSGPITVALANARYRGNAPVQALALALGVEFLYLPPYSANLNLIERLWRLVKREALYGR